LALQTHDSFRRRNTSKSLILNWHARLLVVICCSLSGWLCWDVLQATAQGPPHLSVEGSGGLAVPGGEATYHIRLLNWTDSIVAGGVISHTLPAGFSYVPGSTQVTVAGWPINQSDPITYGGTLSWGPFQLPAAGHTAHNPYGAHTFVQDFCLPEFIDYQLDQALELVGSGGYVTQLFYRITTATDSPDPCAVYFVNAAYDRNLIPILRLQGDWNPVGFWEKPEPGPKNNYAEIAAAFAGYVSGLPRRNTHPLYITIWNEPDLWIEWSGKPNAREYGRFFVAASNAIHDLHDPRIRVLNGAVTPANTAFIRQLMKVPGFVSAFDAWASHCYPYNHPPSYNIHQATAQYGNAVIDCYIEERDTIARYGGRTGFKFVIKETGHGLGDNLYAFEGFPRITESNRARYISSAFNDYWRKWPEVIAVTPFELGDPWGGWEWLDWIDYKVSLDPFHFADTPHHQYNVVTALRKPQGAPVPHGIEITFRARIAGDLSPGRYLGQLAGTASGVTAALPQTTQVQVVARVEHIYLPLAAASRNGGVWYLEAASEPLAGNVTELPPGPTGEVDGAIIPTHFLDSESHPRDEEGSQVTWNVSHTFDAGEPQSLALDEGGGHAYIGLTGGELLVFDLGELEIEKHISLDSDLRSITPGPRPDTIYGTLGTGQVVLVDVVRGEVISRASGLGHPRKLVFDRQTESLLITDAAEQVLIRFTSDLSGRLAVYALDAAPDQMLLDPARRRLYVTLPGARRVLALDADTLQPMAETTLVGGPLIDMALDVAHGRLYVLSALSPRYRGISVLRTDDLSSLALVAGSPNAPLQQATALALSATGRLWVAEGTHLYQISPEDFHVVNQTWLETPVEQGELVIDLARDWVVRLGSSNVFVGKDVRLTVPLSP